MRKFNQLIVDDEQFLKHETMRKEYDKRENQKYGFPALISFFIPGLGQIFKGQILKALLIWIVGGILAFLFCWTIIVPFCIWAWNVYDAYNS